MLEDLQGFPPTTHTHSILNVDHGPNPELFTLLIGTALHRLRWEIQIKSYIKVTALIRMDMQMNNTVRNSARARSLPMGVGKADEAGPVREVGTDVLNTSP